MTSKQVNTRRRHRKNQERIKRKLREMRDSYKKR